MNHENNLSAPPVLHVSNIHYRDHTQPYVFLSLYDINSCQARTVGTRYKYSTHLKIQGHPALGHRDHVPRDDHVTS